MLNGIYKETSFLPVYLKLISVLPNPETVVRSLYLILLTVTMQNNFKVYLMF